MYLRTFAILVSISLIAVFICSASARDFRSEIEVTDLEANSGLTYEVAENLQVGDKEYTDRDYTFTDMPDYLLGLTWIRTANNDKQNPDLEISFKIDKAAYVYTLWIASDPAEHDWFQDNYTKTDDEVGSTDEPLAVYKSNNPFAAGEVKTYQANTGAGLYVIVLEAVVVTSVEASGKLGTTWSKIKKN